MKEWQKNEVWDKWYENVQIRSEDLLAELSMTELDDSSGWGAILVREQFLPKEHRMSVRSGVLLTGETGCGKHNAAYHVVKALQEDDYQVMYVNGEDFTFADDEKELVHEYLNALLDVFYNESEPLCLMVEEPERSSHCRQLLQELGGFAQQYHLNEDYPALYLVVITEDEQIMPRTLRNRLRLCRMTKPDKLQRRRYMVNNQEASVSLKTFLQDEHYDVLVDATAGMNYSELRDFYENLDYMYTEQGNVFSMEDLRNLARSQNGQATMTVSADGSSVVAMPEAARSSQWEPLIDRLCDLIDHLPELLERLPAAIPMRQAEAEPEKKREEPREMSKEEMQQETDKQLKEAKDKFDKMPTSELAANIFTPDEMEELNRLIEADNR